jgi:hypothetical protein
VEEVVRQQARRVVAGGRDAVLCQRHRQLAERAARAHLALLVLARSFGAQLLVPHLADLDVVRGGGAERVLHLHAVGRRRRPDGEVQRRRVRAAARRAELRPHRRLRAARHRLGVRAADGLVPFVHLHAEGRNGGEVEAAVEVVVVAVVAVARAIHLHAEGHLPLDVRAPRRRRRPRHRLEEAPRDALEAARDAVAVLVAAARRREVEQLEEEVDLMGRE